MALRHAAMRLALRCARVATPGFAWWVGGALGHTFGGLPLRDQLRCREHLARAYPDRDRRWIARTARATFRHAGRMALWTLCTQHLPPRRLCRGMVVEGGDNLRATARACRRGEGTVGFSGHFGNWELLARVGGAVVPLTLIGRRLRDPALDAIVAGMRSAAGGTRVVYQDEGALPCLRQLREGRLLATLPDQDVPRLAGVFVPWFGIPAYTPSGPAALAAKTGSPVQPTYLYRHGGRWVIHWGPRWTPPRGVDPRIAAEQLTARVMAYEEALVRRHPEQWVWWHKRWRTRPPEESGEMGDGASGAAAG
jgi:Kdo2-lipid IVA lauroyltransferase/acyltransferase